MFLPNFQFVKIIWPRDESWAPATLTEGKRRAQPGNLAQPTAMPQLNGTERGGEPMLILGDKVTTRALTRR
jgi:hypothetical protein